MPLEFIYLNSSPVVAVNCDNRKAMGKEKWHKVKFEKSTKNDGIEFREQNTHTHTHTKRKQTNKKKTIKTNKPTNKKKTKWKSSLKSTNTLNVSS